MRSEIDDNGNGSDCKTDRSGYWIEGAEYDLETARALRQTGRHLYVGFTCHLTTEKALKAIIAKQGFFPPKIHNLTRLAELAGIKDELGDEQKFFLANLNQFALQSRYPSSYAEIAGSLNDEKSAQCISRTEEFLTWIKKKL